MKKLISVLCIVSFMSLFIAGCGTSDKDNESSSNENNSIQSSELSTDTDSYDKSVMRANLRILYDDNIKDPDEYGYVGFFFSPVNQNDYMIVFLKMKGQSDKVEKLILVKNDGSELELDTLDFLEDINEDTDTQSLSLYEVATMQEIVIEHTVYKNLLTNEQTEVISNYYHYDITGDKFILSKTEQTRPEYEFEYSVAGGVIKSNENDVEEFLNAKFRGE